ncbi:MAG: alpha/beta hydrolase fold domain-containing protein [Celeribacter sp.]|jgi:acetyl esterase
MSGRGAAAAASAPPPIEDGIADPFATLTPEIAEFTRLMAADAASHPRRDRVPVAQARSIAAAIREPWAQGGPRMAQETEHRVPTRHGDLRLRLYQPEGGAPAEEAPECATASPVLIYLPGGGWTLFDIDTHDRVMREYADRTGIAVAGIDYSRAPEAKFPQAIEEITDAIGWLAAQAPALGLDPAAMLLGGDSAGANLTVAVALGLRDAALPPLRGMVLNYGVYDPCALRESALRFGAGDLPLSSHVMQWFTWNYLRHAGQINDRRVRVLGAELKGLPPALLVVADHDLLHDENLDMAIALQAAGVSADLRVYPGTVHSFLEAVSIAPVAVTAFDDSAAWIQARLREAPPRGKRGRAQAMGTG